MDELTQARLLAEYQANVDLWQHDDQLRQARSGNFLTVNTGLLAVLGTLATLEPAAPYFKLILLLFGAFGLIVAVNWYVISARSAEYVRFRRIQLRAIEAQLPGLTTFLNTYTAFYREQAVSFPAIADSFRISDRARRSSTMAENRLPVFVGGLWLICIGIALALLFSALRAGPA